MRIIEEVQLDFADVLIQPKRSSINSRKDVDIYREFIWHNSNGAEHKLRCIPISSANMGSCGTLQMAEVLSKNGYLCALEKHYTCEDICTLFSHLEDEAKAANLSQDEYTQRISLTIGVNDGLDVLEAVAAKHKVSIITIDIANGYMSKLIDKVKEVRAKFPDVLLVAGNVVTADIVTDLVIAGANVVKIQIGAGSVCITRMKTGVGRPALSTIIECADAAHQLHAYVMSDGGIVFPGDICKAFCAGADFIMAGGIFSGCNEAAGDVVEVDGKKFKQYYGMSSKYAQEKHFGKFNGYRASEGRTKLIPCTGPLEDTLNDINGSLRSCCSYIGCHKLKHMPKHATFYKVNRQLNNPFSKCKDF